MDLAANLIKTIVEQRIRLAGDNCRQEIETFLDPATQQAKHILSYGLDIAVHVSLIPKKCHCRQICQKAVEFEVWKIRVKTAIDSSDATTILPIFLQQAILSQLHFSPFNAWLLDKHKGRLPRGHRCVYRISTNTGSPALKFKESHSFPCCIVDGGVGDRDVPDKSGVNRDGKEVLKIDVEWMSKGDFPQLPECCEITKANQLNFCGGMGEQEEDPPVIHDCPVQQTFTEPHALIAFTASSNISPRLLIEKKRIRRNTTGCETGSSLKDGHRDVYGRSPILWKRGGQANAAKQVKGSPSSGLLFNFEESVLKGRIQPINCVEGFKLQLIIQDRFNNTSPIELPIKTYFFNISDDNTPSLYLGNCALDTNGREPIRISKHSTIQATVFNPQGSVVKIFIVPIKVNIPPNSKSFVRQRAYCMPKGVPIEKAERNWLRFLIHFRLATDRHGRVFLHTEIKLLFANKVDLDVQKLISGREFHLVTNTETPQAPVYSTSRLNLASNLVSSC